MDGDAGRTATDYGGDAVACETPWRDIARTACVLLYAPLRQIANLITEDDELFYICLDARVARRSALSVSMSRLDRIDH